MENTEFLTVVLKKTNQPVTPNTQWKKIALKTNNPLLLKDRGISHKQFPISQSVDAFVSLYFAVLHII